MQLHWSLKAVGVYALARLSSTLLFLAVAAQQGANYWTAASPSYFEFLNIWDVEWFERIYNSGYPNVLPTDESGNVMQNAWAFMPAFPILVRALSIIVPLDWVYLAPITATLVGFAMAIVVYRLFSIRFSQSVSLWGLYLFGASAASPVFQVGYAESLGITFLALALHQLLRKNYFLAGFAIILFSFTRPGALAFALLIFLLLTVEWFNYLRYGSWNKPRLKGLLWLLPTSILAGFSWLITAAIATGRPDAYLATELAWRAGYVGHDEFLPFEGIWTAAGYFLGEGTGQLMLLFVIGLVAWFFSSPAAKSLGTELYLWSASYLIYLAAVLFPQSSTVRLLLPAFPLFAAFATLLLSLPRAAKIAAVVVGILLQYWWLMVCWHYVAPDFSPP